MIDGDVMLDRQPHLSDGRFSLIPMRAEDFPLLYAVARDPLLWAQHPAHDRHEEAVFRDFFDEGLASGGSLLIVDDGDGQVIGHSRFDHERAQADEVEIGWTFLARSHWGGGANRAVKRMMLAHALQCVARAIFLVGETNMRSRRAMEKIGGVLTDRQDRVEMAGRPVVHVIYAIDRAGFAAGPLSFPAGSPAPTDSVRPYRS